MKIAVYPGSFNPFHDGHMDIVNQTHSLFDKFIIVRLINPAKPANNSEFNEHTIKKDFPNFNRLDKIKIATYEGLLKDYVEYVKADAVIKGLRNAIDFQYEKDMQYWNEDLGIKIPTLYIISDRNLTHISSSAIRAIRK